MEGGHETAHLVLGLLVLLGGATALAWVLAPRTPAKPDIPRLQALATKSCRCARAKPGEDGKRSCWAEFEKQAALFDPGQYFTACEPISPKGYCFGDDSKACVTMEYSGIPDASLCSHEEARVAEAAFEDAFKRFRAGDKSASPDRAVVAVSQALARGEKLASSSSDGRCGG